MMPSSCVSDDSTASPADACGAVLPVPNRFAAMIVAAGLAGVGEARCNGAGPKNCQPQYAITSASAQPAASVASAETYFIAPLRADARRYNRARFRPMPVPA